MVEKMQQEMVTLKGRLKMEIAAKTSVNGDEYYSVPMEVSEMEKNREKLGQQIESIMLIFWKKNFDERNQSIIANLKENQPIVVHGHLGGRDNGLLRVVELETEDSDSDIFI